MTDEFIPGSYDQVIRSLKHQQVDDPEMSWQIQQLINRLEAKDAATTE